MPIHAALAASREKHLAWLGIKCSYVQRWHRVSPTPVFQTNVAQREEARTHSHAKHAQHCPLARMRRKGGGHARAKPNDHHDQHEDKELKAGAHAQDEQRTRKSEDGPRAYDLFVTSKGNHGKQVV